MRYILGTKIRFPEKFNNGSKKKQSIVKLLTQAY